MCSLPTLLSSVMVFLTCVACSKLSRIMTDPLPFASLPIDTARFQPPYTCCKPAPYIKCSAAPVGMHPRVALLMSPGQ